MRIKLDENLPESAIPILFDAGHDPDTTHAEGLDGADDPEVLAGASADSRLLITLDRGLGTSALTHPELTVAYLSSASTTSHCGRSAEPSNAPAPPWTFTTSQDALPSGATVTFASAVPEPPR